MPPAKRRVQLNVDAEVAEQLEEMYREAVKNANEKGLRIPSFSEVVNNFLRRALKLPVS